MDVGQFPIWQFDDRQWPVGHLPAVADGYLLFCGAGSITAIDYGTPVAFAASGATEITTDAALAVGAVGYLALRAVSAAGRVETNTACVTKVVVGDDDTVVGDPPASITRASATAAAGGAVEVECWHANDADGVAASEIRLVAIPAAGLLAVDWAAPRHTWRASAHPFLRRYAATLDGCTDGTLVRLAARPYAADGTAGEIRILPPVAIDATAPAPTETLHAEVIGS